MLINGIYKDTTDNTHKNEYNLLDVILNDGFCNADI